MEMFYTCATQYGSPHPNMVTEYLKCDWCNWGTESLILFQSLTLLWSHGLYPARLLCPWDFLSKTYWSGLLFPTPRDLPNPGIEPCSPALVGRFFTIEPLGKPLFHFITFNLNNCQLWLVTTILDSTGRGVSMDDTEVVSLERKWENFLLHPRSLPPQTVWEGTPVLPRFQEKEPEG